MGRGGWNLELLLHIFVEEVGWGVIPHALKMISGWPLSLAHHCKQSGVTAGEIYFYRKQQMNLFCSSKITSQHCERLTLVLQEH